MTLPRTFGLLAAALVLATASIPASAQKVVVEAGTILTQADGAEPIEDGVIVIEGGRITAIGARDEVEIPWDAPVLGGPDFTAFPGFVEAHTSSGLDRSNETIDVAPFLSLRDAVDPVSFFFEQCLRAGITTVNLQHGANCVVGAQGMIVRPTGMTVNEMTVRPVHGVKVSASPKSGKSSVTQAQTLRGAFSELKRYLEQLVQEKKDGADYARREALYQGRELEGEKAKGRAMKGSAWTVEGLELVPRGEIEEQQEPLLAIVEGELDVFLHCTAPNQVHLAIGVARENGFLDRSVFVLSSSCYHAVDTIAETGRPAVLTGSLVHVETDPVTGEESEIFVPGVFHDAGVKFALSMPGGANGSLWFQAAMCTGLGLDRDDALRAVTLGPAEILGLAGEVGSLEVGKLGNIVLFTGDPLSVTSRIEHVIIEGNEVYDWKTDSRNRHLLEGEEPVGTAAEQAEETDEEKTAKQDDEAKKDGE